MQWLAPSVQTEGPGTAEEAAPAKPGQAKSQAQAGTAQPDPLISGPAPALWAGVGAFLLIFLIAMMLIIRGRVTGAKPRAGKAGPATYFEPAGEDAEITFDEDEAETEPQDAQEQWRDDEADEAEITVERGHESGSLHEDEPALQEAEQSAPEPAAPEEPEKKKKPAFAGLFGRKPKPAPTPEEEAAPSDAAPDDEALYPDEPEEPALGFFAPEVESGPQNAPEEAPRDEPPAYQPAPEVKPAEAFAHDGESERIGHAEEAAREALKRAEDAEALARDLQRANEEAQRVMTVGLKQQEAALDQRAEAMAEMERRLSAMSDEFKERLETVSAATAKLSESAPQAQGPAFHDAPAGVSEDHFAEFANLLGEQFDALRGEVKSAVDKLSKRLDHLPSSPAAATATAARVQLSDLLGDALAPQRYKLGYKLPTGRTAEAAIIMPGPMAPIAIDARFPVEAFDSWQLSRNAGTETELRRAVLRNIADVGEKLIAPEETADCAMMFIPSENILSELHAHFSDLVQESYRARVFMVSPTSLMATLHTISAVMAGAGLRESSAMSFLDELHALRERVATLESTRQNGAGKAPEKAEKPAETQPAPQQPVQYSAVFDSPPARQSGESGDDKSPFPLR
ncbi:DNA recombination protein RmuC [Hyphococcus luteus]|nr:DNA recombination protein RmuC [Marinicaulis flavus]